MTPPGHFGAQCVVVRCTMSGTYSVRLGDDVSFLDIVEEFIPWHLCPRHAEMLGVIDESDGSVLLTAESVPHGWRLYSAPRWTNSAVQKGTEVVLYPPGVELPRHPYKK